VTALSLDVKRLEGTRLAWMAQEIIAFGPPYGSYSPSRQAGWGLSRFVRGPRLAHHLLHRSAQGGWGRKTTGKRDESSSGAVHLAAAHSRMPWESSKIKQGMLQSYDTLSLPDVYVVVSYYLANAAPIDGYLRTCDQKAEVVLQKLEAAGMTGRVGKEELLARARARGSL
jgi:hypothetical protein